MGRILGGFVLTLSFKSIGLAFSLLTSAELVKADPITLISADGKMEIRGELIGYNGENYRLLTPYGDLTVRDTGLVCLGKTCPKNSERVAHASFIGNQAPLLGLIPELVETYSLINGAELTVERLPVGDIRLHVTDELSEKKAEILVSPADGSLAFTKLEKPDSTMLVSTRARTIGGTETASLEQEIVTDQPRNSEILALDAAVIIVSPENPIESLSLKSLDRILRGRVTNWRSLGGTTAPITIYLPQNLPDLLDSFPKHVLQASRNSYISEIIYLRDEVEVTEAVAADPFGIGLTRFSKLQDAKPLGLKSQCGLVSVPSSFSIKSGEYPLGYTYYVAKPKKRQAPFVRGFLNFLKSDLSQTVVQDSGFISLQPISSGLNDQGLRLSHAISSAGAGVDLPDLQRMAQVLNGAQRLSTTFRFSKDGKSLDARSVRYAKSLIQGIQDSSFANKKVFLVGFSDASGPAEINETVSLRRAQAVLELIQSSAPDGSLDSVDIQALGFGETSPIACNETKPGQILNRRVEVWIKDRS